MKTKIDSGFLDKHWSQPAKKEVSTPLGTLQCWIEEHPEGADRGGYRRMAEINGEVFTEDTQEGWMDEDCEGLGEEELEEEGETEYNNYRYKPNLSMEGHWWVSHLERRPYLIQAPSEAKLKALIDAGGLGSLDLLRGNK